MTTFKQFLIENKYSKAKMRFEELKIKDALDPFLGWIYDGKFYLMPDESGKFEHAFYAIRSVLPKDVLATYRNLPTLFRGFSFKTIKDKKNALKNGFDVQSKIASWASFEVADHYVDSETTGIILKHKPKFDEVLIVLNNETLNFLSIKSSFVVNKGEAILSIPKLRFEPKDIL